MPSTQMLLLLLMMMIVIIIIIIIIIMMITDCFRCYFSLLVEQIAHYKAKNQNTVKANSYGKNLRQR